MAGHKMHETVEHGKMAGEIIKELPKLSKKKSVIGAGVAGLFFGAIGVAVYTESFKDFLVCMGLFLGLTLLSGGLLILPAWLFSPIYGMYRVYTSNEKH